MAITVDATFENGVLRPTTPLELAEGAAVRLTILGEGESATPADCPLDAVIGIGSGPSDGADITTSTFTARPDDFRGYLGLGGASALRAISIIA